jgi:hypothetical protein
MAMADAPRHDPAGSDSAAGAEPTALSWAEQETLDALKRLARAQSQLQALEEQLPTGVVPLDPADGQRLVEIHAELVRARSKAAGRFGRAAARDRLDQLETSERLLLEHMGLSDYDDYVAASAPPRSTVAAVDPQMLAFARQELISARQAWLEVQAMAVPDADPPEPADAAPPLDGPDVA